MATSKKQKKIVSKEDLRRLMKEKQTTLKTSTKRIEHPLSKYNSLDQLVCVLCNSVIKSDLLWTAHIQSKQHKEKLLLAKSKTGVGGALPPAVKRKSPDNNIGPDIPTKRSKENLPGIKSGLPPDFFDQNGSNVRPLKQPASTSRSGLAAYSSSEEEDDESTPVVPVNPAMPPGKSHTTVSATKPASIADVLPEGFFDDPKMDAKVRHVEYRDKMDDEYELFQKAMKEETHVSEAIIEEEDVNVNVGRNIDEIDEQIQMWKEVNDLQEKKEKITEKGSRQNPGTSTSDEELDEEELNEFFNWRSKKSWK